VPQLKVPDVPIMHSYRVFSLRDKHSDTSTTSTSSAAAEEGDANNNQDEDESVKLAAATLTVPVKPILMCFICKISFGYAKSFVSHATAEHALLPNEAEQRLLGQRNTSAIIQGVGKEKEPLLSFLEPKHKSPLLPQSGSQQQNPANSSHPTTANLHQQFQQQLMAVAAVQAAAAAALRQTSSQSSSSSPFCPRDSPQTASVSNGSLNLVLCKSEAECSEGETRTPAVGPVAGEDCSELADLAHLEKIAKAAAAAIQQQPDDGLLLTVPSPKSQSPSSSSAQAASPKSSSGHLPLHLDGGHMTMLHSRNSCKTLKCPKCNWHYKYQETLEAHMKEKHPDSDISCLYCLTNQPHPRLSRGETYTCGYKPYRCEVCNYSTTTKGNLSIHMQSDKHINNVQELQNGNIPADHIAAQSQAMAVAVAAAAAAGGSNSSSPGVPVEKVSPVAAPPLPAGPPLPLPASQKPKATWRCDVCNYETNVARNLRIHMTSEKHTHNMLVLQQNMKQMQMQAQQLSALQQAGLLAAGDAGMFHPGLFAALTGAAATDSGLQPEAAMADMAYNHALLLMASQQQHQQQRAVAAIMQQQQQQHGKQQPAVDMDHPDPSMRLDAVPYDDSCRLFHCCVCTTFSCDTIEALSQHISRDRTGVREDEVIVLIPGGPNSAPQQFCKLCEYKSPLKANFQLHCKTDKHLQHLQHVNHMKEGGSRTEWKVKYVKVSNPVQVRCNVCDYYTNSIHKLAMHTEDPRHKSATQVFMHLQLSERIVRASQPEDAESRKSLYYHCSLCHAATRSKIALVHHISTVKHLQHQNMRQLKIQQQQQMGQLSLPKTMDEEIRELFQVKEASPNDHIVFADDGEYLFSFPAERPLQCRLIRSDVRPEPESPTSRPPSASSHDPVLPMDAASASMLKQALQDQVRGKSEPSHCCPFCKYTCSSEVKMQLHVMTQHAKQPVDNGKRQLVLRCPLCPGDVSPFRERATLESHLIENHQVTKENLGQIFNLLVQQQAEVAVPEKRARLSHEEHEEILSGSGPDNADARSDSGDSLRDMDANSIEQQAAKFLELGGGKPAAISDRHVYKYRCNQCSLAFKTMEKLQLHSQYHLIRAATQCVICRRSFRSVEALQRHVESAHSDMSEREEEVYRQSLANNPLSALMAGGVRRVGVNEICSSEFLRRESARIDASCEGDEESDAAAGESQIEDMDVSEGPANDGDQHHNSVEDYLNSQAIAEDSYNDPSRKFKCHRCKVAFTRQSYLTSHNKTLLHRKGEKMSYPMEKYLDPNRPFKCEICKESFTQKNILLVHFNSVSHLHKLKQQQSLKDTSSSINNNNSIANNHIIAERSSPSPTAESQEANAQKLFKCNICKFSTSLSSSLDIHIRSVLHQTRASKLHDLTLSGQFDITQPMIERPEVDSSGNVVTVKPGVRQLESDKQQFKLQHQLLQQQQQHQQQVALNEHLLMSSGMSAGTGSSPASGSQFPCVRCGACFSSQESCIQHQQICCLFAASQPTGSPVQKAAESETCNRSQTASEQLAALRSKGYILTSCRTKPPIHKHLLETWGFEIVMQFNENHHKRRRPRESDEKGNTDGQGQEQVADAPADSVQNQSKDENTGAVKAEPVSPSPTNKSAHLPEIDRCKCDTCHREFSSIWVLKAHREEVHKDVVPLSAVESFAAEFRKDYDSRAPARPVSRDPLVGECEQGVTNDRRSTPIQTSEVQAAPSSSSPPNMMNQMSQANDMTAASQMAAQMQFTQLLMSMGLAGMGMPGMPFAAAAAMGIPPHLMQLLLGGQIDPVLAAAFNQAASAAAATAAPSPTPANPIPEPLLAAAAQQKLMQQQQLSAAQQQKRARTRITDDQLKILRQYFDINNSPTEEQLQEMSEKSGLPLKVIKHWFRNTLFKERQRNKDSPYNFNNPPSTFLNLEEYEKTGETKVMAIDEPADISIAGEKVARNHVQKLETVAPVATVTQEKQQSEVTKQDSPAIAAIKSEVKGRKASTETTFIPSASTESHEKDVHTSHNDSHSARESFDYAKSFSMSPHSESSVSSVSTNDTSSQHASQTANQLFPGHGLHPFAGSGGLSSGISPNPLQLAIDVAQRTQSGGQSHPQTPGSANSRDHSSPGSGSAPGKRANRTRFTDYQIKVLQEFFESNAYPKDDDLEYLSKLLNLSPRVIVVWFQNARQKARKVYENQPAAPDDDSNPGRFQRTPGLNYQCKKCMQVFQRYYELIKHQKSACFKDENPLAVQLKAAQDARQCPSSPGGANTGSNSSTATEKNSSQSPSGGAFRCEKCSLLFPRFDLWREHQLVHLMNPNLFPSYPPTSPFGILQYEGQANHSNNNTLPHTPVKRKLPDDEDSQESFSGHSSHTSNHGQDPPRDKRLRTTILPEQLDYLYQKYQIESNPSRKMLENIAKEVGLKKRVVQVWFQNTRARERKGQFRAHQQVIHKRCPFCRALFKARSALESHLATRHADQYTKGDINIDALPDGDPSEEADDKNIPAELIQMKQYYENSKIIKKYMEELTSGNMSPADGSDLSQTLAKAVRAPGESPLDLSKPVALCRPAIDSGKFEDNGFDTRSDNDSDSGSDGEGMDDMSCPNSPAPGSTTSSVTSPAAMGGSGQTRSSSQANSANKRFRTQMSTVQLKVMKSVFADYKTPSMAECETLGREVGLPKRVVQVWFQNARAKEKKAKLAECKAFGTEYSENSCVKAAEECKVCSIKYNVRNSSTSMQDHLFSHKHIENLKNHIDSVKKVIENADDSVDFPGASCIVMPTLTTTPAIGDPEAETRSSQSAANLMQMMGLTAPVLGINGDSKWQKKEHPVAKVTNPALDPKGKEANCDSVAMTGNGGDAADGEANAYAFMFGNTGLHNAYFSAAAGSFLPNAMYNTSGRNQL
jgi:AT-binding transcription factor 1